MIAAAERRELKYWKFNLDQTEYGLAHGWGTPEFDDSVWMDVEAYTSWETYQEALFDYEGCGWFRTWVDVKTSPDKHFVLKFDGVGGMAQVYVNGKYVGGTDNRYLPFSMDITSRLWDGKNLIAVLVDNSFRGREHLTGGKRIEWVLYGGLTHRIWLEEQPVTYISHVRADAKADGSLKVTVDLENREGMSFKDDFSGSLYVGVPGLAGCQGVVAVHLGKRKTEQVVFTFQAEQVKLWSPETPNLYDLQVVLNRGEETLHTVTERIGFRTVAVEGTKLMLNGKEILFKGANRYDEYAPYGICPPEELIRQDLLEMKKCGMNIIRIHYPQDDVHYRIADEIGIMYMIEVPLNWWSPSADQTIADWFPLAAEAVDCLDRTFRSFCNHPSWTVWSVGNECSHSRTANQQMFRMLADRMRALDCGRLISYAVSQPILDEKELDFCDFLAINYYSGILSNHESEFPEQMTKVLERKLGIAQQFYPNKPHVMTEFGYVCVGGIHGNVYEGRYAEDFGTTFLKADCAEFLKDPNLKGMIIWCWADYRHRRGFVPSKTNMGIQATYGPWGLVTMDRKPKQMLLDTMREIYQNWEIPEEGGCQDA